jgi:hypothetical protein
MQVRLGPGRMATHPSTTPFYVAADPSSARVDVCLDACSAVGSCHTFSVVKSQIVVTSLSGSVVLLYPCQRIIRH